MLNRSHLDLSLSRRTFLRCSASLSAMIAIVGLHGSQARGSDSKTLRFGFNLWPGAIAWQVAENKGFFKSNGLNVEIKWFDVLADQIAAFNAEKIDFANLTINDQLIGLEKGVQSKTILIPDISAGADAIVSDLSIKTLKDLVGKNAGVELGTVGQFLYLQALEHGGIKPESVKTLNMAADAAIAALIAGKVQAAYAYDPFIGQAVKSGKGKVIFSSKDVPGLLPDIWVVQQKLIQDRPDDVQKIVNCWFQTQTYREKNLDKALAIEAKRAGVSVADYKDLQKGLQWLSPKENLAALQPGNTTQSAIFATEKIIPFMLDQKLLTRRPSSPNELFDPSFVKKYLASKS